MRSHRPILWVLLAAFIAGVAGVLLAVAGVSVWDVEARGEHLLPYPEKVLRVRILETATVYFDAERPGPSDILTGITLACGGAVVLFTWWLVRTTVARRRAWFFLLAGLGLTYLGVDDLFGAHETFGHNLRFLADLPGVDRPDDVVLALFLA
ncbi:MAG: hypothetical protein ACRDLY_03440, partial [Thermoleophilaceae bacterium]